MCFILLAIDAACVLTSRILSHSHFQSDSNMARSGLPTWPCWREVAVPIVRRVPEAADTVFSTPDDGFSGHSKHVE